MQIQIWRFKRKGKIQIGVKRKKKKRKANWAADLHFGPAAASAASLSPWITGWWGRVVGAFQPMQRDAVKMTGGTRSVFPAAAAILPPEKSLRQRPASFVDLVSTATNRGDLGSACVQRGISASALPFPLGISNRCRGATKGAWQSPLSPSLLHPVPPNTSISGKRHP